MSFIRLWLHLETGILQPGARSLDGLGIVDWLFQPRVTPFGARLRTEIKPTRGWNRPLVPNQRAETTPDKRRHFSRRSPKNQARLSALERFSLRCFLPEGMLRNHSALGDSCPSSSGRTGQLTLLRQEQGGIDVSHLDPRA